MSSQKLCKYESKKKVKNKLTQETINFFDISLDNFPSCKSCIYRKRNKCYSAFDCIQDENIQIIDKYNDYIINKSLPREIKIEVTPKCNLDCQFCFNINSFDREAEELSTNEIFKIIDNIAQSGIKRVRFTGGEPLVRTDIFNICKYAKSKDLYVKINTNSTLINEDNIPFIKKYVDSLLLPFHSLKDTSDKIKLIQKLSKLKLDLNIDTVAIKENIKNLEKFYDIMKDFDALWFVERPVPNKDFLNPIDSDDIIDLVEKSIKIKSIRKDFSIAGLPYCSYDPVKVSQVSSGGQHCGPIDILAVSPSGIIKPCYSIDENLGSSIDINFNKAWKGKFALKIRSLSSLPVICQKCKYLIECLGGCRFAAKLINGSYSALDPLAQPENYKDLLIVQ